MCPEQKRKERERERQKTVGEYCENLKSKQAYKTNKP